MEEWETRGGGQNSEKVGEWDKKIRGRKPRWEDKQRDKAREWKREKLGVAAQEAASADYSEGFFAALPLRLVSH